VTTDIIHLHDEALHYYKGSFANFEEKYEQKRRAANKEFEVFEKKMKNAQVRFDFTSTDVSCCTSVKTTCTCGRL
jgi:ATPase subunit of ABC transporter with duplicated ATPase domains